MFLEVISTTVSADMLLFVALILGLGLVVYGHASKLRLFNLFGSGVFIFLAMQFTGHIVLLIICLGITMFELYYTFLGGD
jgi:hypothetical protein